MTFLNKYKWSFLIAVDRQWNVDEVSGLVAKTPVFLDSIAAAVSAAIAEGLNTES